MSYKDGSRQVGGKAYRQHTSLKNFVRQRDNYTCQLCGGYGDIVDHIIPYAISHDSSLSNLRVLCRRCNLATRRPRESSSLSFNDWWAYIESELLVPA